MFEKVSREFLVFLANREWFTSWMSSGEVSKGLFLHRIEIKNFFPRIGSDLK